MITEVVNVDITSARARMLDGKRVEIKRSVHVKPWPAKVKKTWLKALRSGRFRQTDEELHVPSHGAYCCLGVYLKRCKQVDDMDLACATDLQDFYSLMGPARRSRDEYFTDDLERICVGMNDDLRLTFHEIADVLEELLPVES